MCQKDRKQEQKCRQDKKLVNVSERQEARTKVSARQEVSECVRKTGGKNKSVGRTKSQCVSGKSENRRASERQEVNACLSKGGNQSVNRTGINRLGQQRLF